MFICQACGKTITCRKIIDNKPVVEKPVMVVTKKREKEYYRLDKDGNSFPVKPSHKKGKSGDIARGWEIEKEIMVCKECADAI